MTQKILVEFKQRISQLELKPFSDGRFEVFVNSQKIFSKLAEHRFPEASDIIAELKTHK
ncbi:MAG: SelT/SelW/SelH family protein [Acidobacteria bacterium]|nr:SelT/SelW/SelH family protein [Acidobacteriota bacterium]